MPTSPALYAPQEPGRIAVNEREKQDGKKAAKPDGLVARYNREVERYKRSTSSWYEEGEQIVKTYLDEGRDGATQVTTRKFALLWANVETLKPAVYAKIPQVICSRRYKDKDPVGRVCAELMERATNTTFDLYHADETFRLVRDDRLLPGRGQGWVRYEASLEKYQDQGEDGQPVVGEDGEPVYREKLKSEKVCTDYVHWRDFGHNVARSWADVWLVWRCVYKTQDEVAERWGAKVAAGLQYSNKQPATTSDQAAAAGEADALEDCCKIFEFWDKRAGRTAWLAENQREFLESGEPPINFRNGFPCPEPCYATKTGKELKPKPDYRYYRDQAMEINDLTAKISGLTDWLIVKGFIPAAPSGVADPIEEVIRDKGNKELFVQVQNYTEWTEKGGAAKLIDWLPIQHIVVALKAAIDARNQLIQDVFQLTGIADVLRGQTDPNETLGAQELKSQTGTRRLKNTRDEIARWCKDIALLTAEVIAEKFEPESIADITGYKYQPQPPTPPVMAGLGGLPGMMPQGQEAPMPSPQGGMGPQMQQPGALPNPQGQPGLPPGVAPAAANPTGAVEDDQGLVFDDRHIALLRDDKLRSFRIEVETDETGQADEGAEKDRTMEMATVVGGYLEKAVTVVGAAPALGDPAKEILMLLCRRFRAGKGIEESLDRGFSQAVQQAKAAAQQGDPKIAAEQAKAEVVQMKAQADVQLAQVKAQAEFQIEQQRMQLEQQRMQFEARLAAQQLQIEAAQAQQKARTDAALAQRKQDQDWQVEMRDMMLRMHTANTDRQIQQQNTEQDRALEARNADADREMAAKNAAADRKIAAKAATKPGASR